MPIANEEVIKIINNIKSSTSEAEKEQLQSLLIQDNEGLIRDAVNKVLVDKFYFNDMLQEGYMAFLKAIENFDTTKNIKFQTYAYTVIQSKVKRAIKEQTETIVTPEYVSTNLNKIMDVECRLEETLKRKPTIEEIISELGMSEEEYLGYKEIAMRSVTLTDSADDETIYNMVNRNDPENTLIDEEEVEELKDLLYELDDREKDVIESFYGIDKEKESVVDIANRYGISSDRVRQIIKESLRKLKMKMREENEN